MSKLFTDIAMLRNRYFVMRHGESEANRAGIILSNPTDGVAAYGLSERGRRQVQDSAAGTRLGSDALLISSDFKRARETADIVHQAWRLDTPLALREALRERFFGRLDKTNDDQYPIVWEADRRDPGHTDYGVESANAVTARAGALIVELEQRHDGRDIVLVAHGDVLQLLQTALARRSAAEHRSLAHLATAEIREIKLAR